MNYRVELTPAAKRDLRALTADTQDRVISALQRLAEGPRAHGARKLRGELRVQDAWRLRVGGYRVLYVIDDEARVVTVFAVGHRARVYRP